MRRFLLVFLVCIIPMQAIATTGYSDFKTDLQQFGMFYKVALVGTKAETATPSLEIAIGKTHAEWRSFMARYIKSPPDVFLGLEDFPDRLKVVDEILSQSLFDVIESKILESHHKLEFVRVALWELRARAGVLSLADKMTDIHLVMEGLYKDLSSEAPIEESELLSLSAILAIKWEEAASLPVDDQDLHEYHQNIEKGREALKVLAGTLGQESRAETLKALKRFKSAYKRVFMLPSVI